MNPYQTLDEKSFWAPAVGRRDMLEINQLWDPKFDIRPRHRIATFGSCFAQHIGRALRARKHSWLQTEPAPTGLSEKNAKLYNYEVFTCRTGNIYTVSLLKQWSKWALGFDAPPSEVFEEHGRFFDPFRPTIEPGGFPTEEELVQSREMTIEAFRKAIETSDIFVFTLGLTESWFHSSGSYEYPMCPGTAAGTFDPEIHQFRNQDFMFIKDTLTETLDLMKTANPNLSFLLTVSPVPLTATMSGNHVLTATVESKSILRAVAGEMSKARADVDYFPSYEIISSTPFQGAFFEENKRSVAAHGVSHVMDSFFDNLERKFGALTDNRSAARARADHSTQYEPDDEILCDEEFLETFAPQA